jgi:hypothetical protein
VVLVGLVRVIGSVLGGVLGGVWEMLRTIGERPIGQISEWRTTYP